MFNSEFYSHVEAYDIAFSDRDINAQCNFVEWCFKNHSTIANPKELTYLDICAGPAPHGIELSKRGWHSIAIDLSQEMKEYTQIKAQKHNAKIDYVLADIRDFNISKKGALAGCYIDSMTHLTTNEDIINHFKAMQKNMLSGGIYIIELAHPKYLFPASEPNQWTIKKEDKEVDVLYGLPDDSYNSITQIWDLTTHLILKQNGKILKQIEKTAKHRFYGCQEFKALIELSGVFDFYTFYGNLLLPAQLLDEKSKSMIAILRFK